MCDNNKENEENIHIITDNIEGFQIQDQNLNTSPPNMQHQHNTSTDAYLNGAADVSQILPWTLNPAHDPFLLPQARGLQYGYDGDHHLRFLTESFSQVVHPGGGGGIPFGLHAELQKMTAQEIMDAKALAASKSHSEAERRRRERINNHLAKLRSLLPSTTKVSITFLLVLNFRANCQIVLNHKK